MPESPATAPPPQNPVALDECHASVAASRDHGRRHACSASAHDENIALKPDRCTLVHRCRQCHSPGRLTPRALLATPGSIRQTARNPSPGADHYLSTDWRGRPKLDAAKVKSAEKFDGKFVVMTNDDTLSAENVALAYKAGAMIAPCFRRMKQTGLHVRPMFHWIPRRR